MAAQRRDESAELTDAYWAMIDLPNSAAFRLIADENKIFALIAVHTSLGQIICDVQGLRLVGRAAYRTSMTSTGMQPIQSTETLWVKSRCTNPRMAWIQGISEVGCLR